MAWAPCSFSFPSPPSPPLPSPLSPPPPLPPLSPSSPFPPLPPPPSVLLFLPPSPLFPPLPPLSTPPPPLHLPPPSLPPPPLPSSLPISIPTPPSLQNHPQAQRKWLQAHLRPHATQQCPAKRVLRFDAASECRARRTGVPAPRCSRPGAHSPTRRTVPCSVRGREFRRDFASSPRFLCTTEESRTFDPIPLPVLKKAAAVSMLFPGSIVASEGGERKWLSQPVNSIRCRFRWRTWRAWTLVVIAVAILVIGLGLSSLGAWTAHRSAVRTEVAAARSEAQAQSAALGAALRRNLDFVNSQSALFTSVPLLTNSELAAWYAALDVQIGIRGPSVSDSYSMSRRAGYRHLGATVVADPLDSANDHRSLHGRPAVPAA